MIARQIRMLFSAYRRDEFADPEGFLAQIGVVFEGYSDEVILVVTSPKTGLQRRSKWPPSIAEVVEACDAEEVAMATRNRYAAMPTPNLTRLPRYVDTTPGRRANVFVPADSLQYPRAYEWAKTTDAADWKHDPDGRQGIWVSIDLFDGYQPKSGLKPLQAPSDAELRARYSRQESQEAAE